MENKCPICKTKIKITDYACKCKVYYCYKHRAPEVHNCSYDYRLAAQILLAKQNPTVVSSKIVPI